MMELTLECYKVKYEAVKDEPTEQSWEQDVEVEVETLEEGQLVEDHMLEDHVLEDHVLEDQVVEDATPRPSSSKRRSRTVPLGKPSFKKTRM